MTTKQKLTDLLDSIKYYDTKILDDKPARFAPNKTYLASLTHKNNVSGNNIDFRIDFYKSSYGTPIVCHIRAYIDDSAVIADFNYDLDVDDYCNDLTTLSVDLDAYKRTKHYIKTFLTFVFGNVDRGVKDSNLLRTTHIINS